MDCWLDDADSVRVVLLRCPLPALCSYAATHQAAKRQVAALLAECGPHSWVAGVGGSAIRSSLWRADDLPRALHPAIQQAWVAKGVPLPVARWLARSRIRSPSDRARIIRDVVRLCGGQRAPQRRFQAAASAAADSEESDAQDDEEVIVLARNRPERAGSGHANQDTSIVLLLRRAPLAFAVEKRTLYLATHRKKYTPPDYEAQTMVRLLPGSADWHGRDCPHCCASQERAAHGAARGPSASRAVADFACCCHPDCAIEPRPSGRRPVAWMSIT